MPRKLGSPGLRAFVHDFVGFARARAILAAVYIVLGAAFESIGIVLLVPLLGIVVHRHGRLERALTAPFNVIGVMKPVVLDPSLDGTAFIVHPAAIPRGYALTIEAVRPTDPATQRRMAASGVTYPMMSIGIGTVRSQCEPLSW